MYNFLNRRRPGPIQRRVPELGASSTSGRWCDGGTTVPVRTAFIVGQSQARSSARRGDAAVAPWGAATAGGGGMMRNVVHGVVNRRFLGLLTGDADVLDELNPIIQVGQALLDAGDGINYPSSTHYLQYHGRNDCVPEYGRYAAGATGLPVVHWFEPEGTYGDPALEPVRATLPVQGNVDGATRVALERPGGHFVGYDQLEINQGFLDDLAAGVAPTIPADGFVFGQTSAFTCVDDRWDVPPVRFARGPQSGG